MRATLVGSIGIGRWLMAAMALAGLVLWAAAFDGVAQADTTGPKVVRIERLDTPLNGAAYENFEWIEVGIVFDEEIVVTGRPTLDFVIGDRTYSQRYNELYSNGMGINFYREVFRYMVDADGYVIPANSLNLAGGTIQDRAGNNASLEHEGIPADARWRVNSEGPILTHVNPISYAGPDGLYHGGDKIQFTAFFTDDVDSSGMETLSITMGTDTREAAHYSTYLNYITFEYTVTTSDNDADGVSIPANPINLNGGKITDSGYNNAILNYTGSETFGNHKVQGIDTTAPTILGVQITSTPPVVGSYTAGDIIEVAVSFSEEVTATGSTLDVEVGDNTRSASASRKEGATVWYWYTVVAADADANGVSIDADSITAGTDGVVDNAGNAANLTHAAVSDAAAHKVEGTDTTAPTITSISITSSAENGPYKVGDKVEFTVQWSEGVSTSPSGRPTLSFLLDDTTAKTAKFSQTNLDTDHDTSKLVFEYEVEVGDMAGKIGVPANAVQLTNSANITDRAGNVGVLISAAVDRFPRQDIFGMGGL